MARMNEGPFGNISGRVGNVVVYMLNGKMVMRTLPSAKPRKATGRQKESQELLAMVMNPLKYAKPFIVLGFSRVQGYSPFHSALSLNLKRMAETREFSYSRLLFSKGKLATAINPKVSIDQDLKLTVSWPENETGKRAADTDVVMLLVLNTSLNHAEFEFNAGKRADGSASIQLRDFNKGNQSEVYIAFADKTGAVTEVSDSAWAGQVVV